MVADDLHPADEDSPDGGADSGERVPGLRSPQHSHHPQVRPVIQPRPLSLLTLIVVSLFLAYAPLSILTILRSGTPFTTDSHTL